jgi:hypothetical protein
MVVINREPGLRGPPGPVTVAELAAEKKAREEVDATKAALNAVNVFSQANTFKSSLALTPEAGGPIQPIGSRAFAVVNDGTLIAGPSPLGDTYAHRNMAPTLFGPNVHRSLLPTLDLFLVGDPPELQGGRRYGLFPYTPATALQVGVFIAGTNTILTVKWDPAFVTKWFEAGLIAENKESLMPEPTAGFGANGTLILEPAGGGEQFAILTLTGKTATTLTVSLVVTEQVGSLTFASGAVVTQLLDTDTTLFIEHTRGWVGNGGFQSDGTLEGSKSTEVHRRTADGGYSVGSKTIFFTATKGLGTGSILREAVEIEDDQSIGVLGGWCEDSSKVTSRLSVGGRAARTVASKQNPASGTVEVDSTYGWPSAGTHYIDDSNGNVFSYTGKTIKKFTGTAVVSGGEILASTRLKLAARDKEIVGAFNGGQVAANSAQGVAETRIGNIGPTAATPEGGIGVNGDTNLWRFAAGVWMTSSHFVASETGGGACFSTRSSADLTLDRWGVGATGTMFWKSAGGVVQGELEIKGSGSAGLKTTKSFQVEEDFVHSGTKAGFFNKAAIVRPNVKLPAEVTAKELCEALESLGLIE